MKDSILEHLKIECLVTEKVSLYLKIKWWGLEVLFSMILSTTR